MREKSKVSNCEACQHIGGEVENRGLSDDFWGCYDGCRETSLFKGQENIIDSRG